MTDMGGETAVIFDFDGVLVDSEIIALAELGACLRRFGIEVGVDEMVGRFLGASFEDIERFVRATSGISPDASFRQDWYARLFERYGRELQMMSGARALLDVLDARGIRHCIASGGSCRRLRFALDVVGLGSRFSQRAFSADEVNRGKPAPDLFLLAADRMQVAPRDCLVVEDSVAGVRAAVAAGMRPVGFVGGRHLADCRERHGTRLLEGGAVSIIENLDEVPGMLETRSEAAGR